MLLPDEGKNVLKEEDEEKKGKVIFLFRMLLIQIKRRDFFSIFLKDFLPSFLS